MNSIPFLSNINAALTVKYTNFNLNEEHSDLVENGSGLDIQLKKKPQAKAVQFLNK